MNFKLASWKLSVSIIIGLILGFWLSGATLPMDPPRTIYQFSSDSVLGFVIGFVITYLIYSLIQKK